MATHGMPSALPLPAGACAPDDRCSPASDQFGSRLAPRSEDDGLRPLRGMAFALVLEGTLLAAAFGGLQLLHLLR